MGRTGPRQHPLCIFCFNALQRSAETAERATTPDLHWGNRISDLVKLGSGSVVPAAVDEGLSREGDRGRQPPTELSFQ